MRKFNDSIIAEAKEAHKPSLYIKKEWVTDEDLTMTLEEYAHYINPMFKYIAGNPTIIAKAKKDGGFFRKMCIPLDGGSCAEYELAYKNDFHVGDVIDKDSLLFCEEKCLKDKHGYVTGNVVEQ